MVIAFSQQNLRIMDCDNLLNISKCISISLATHLGIVKNEKSVYMFNSMCACIIITIPTCKISLTVTNTIVTKSNIRAHKMHSQMHHNYCQLSIFYCN